VAAGGENQDTKVENGGDNREAEVDWDESIPGILRIPNFHELLLSEKVAGW
jgi:hypothetical protein